MQSSVRWMTDAFTWSPLLRLFVKCLPSLSPREQPLPISHVALGRTIFHAGTKSARPSTFLQPLRPYYLGYNRRSMSDGRKLLIPSTSRTLAARRGAPSTNILASLDGPLACAPPRETHRLATLEERGTQDRGPRGHQARQQRAVRPMEYSNTWGYSISEPFRPEELAPALRRLKPVKLPGLDSISPEFILHTGSALKSCFRDFLTSCMRQLKIPKIWRRTLLVAIPKQENPLEDPKSYRPTCGVSIQSGAHGKV